MTVDNFKQISELLDFSEKDTFYFIQILKRRKENPDMKTGVRVINNYYLYSPEDLEKTREKILEDCTKHNARAYINLNRLDLEKIALHTMKQITELIIQGDFRAVKNAYATACGNHHSEKAKRWIIDIDAEILEHKDTIRELVQSLHTEIKGNDYKILAEIPTRSGVHLISNPFNMQKFRDIICLKAKSTKDPLLKMDIHKNSPTLLYCS